MIADCTIAKTKLAQAVQDTLDKSDSAIQKISEGTIAGAIDVDGTSVLLYLCMDWLMLQLMEKLLIFNINLLFVLRMQS